MRTALVAMALLLAAPAGADEVGTPQVDAEMPVKRRDAAQVARDGTFLPTTWSARVGENTKIVLTGDPYQIDFGLAAFYKNRGFSEADGEIEVAVLLARRWGRLGTFANVVYGQGINPDERDAEIRLAALYAANEHVNLGMDVRARLDLGEHDAARDADKLENDFDFIAGPIVSYAVSHLYLTAQAGVHTVVQREVASAGFVALGGVGTAF